MAIETPHGGTRGARPRAGPLLRFGTWMMANVVRRSSRMAASMLVLTTVGAKTGQRREVPLGFIADGADRWLIVAAANGTAKNPAWLHNLAEHPDQAWIEVGHEKVKVRPETLAGDERAAAWSRIVAKTPQYGAQEAKTDREIAIVRLTREA